GCTVITGCKIVSVKKAETFILQAENGTAYRAGKTVFAAGGKAAKQFGTDGQAYSVLAALGHKTTPLYPSLVQLKTEKSAVKGLKGIKERVKLTLFDGKKPLKVATGDLLFTDYGVSGSVVFQISDKATVAADPILEAEFAPELSKERILQELEKRRKDGYIPPAEILNGIVHKKLGEFIVSSCGEQDFVIAETLKRYKIKVVGTLGFDNAQVTKGGVKAEEIDEKTYESKLNSGLYVVGETLDVDGECGGYNLTFAFVSGIVAARTIKKQNEKYMK
ncbi:MAG: aminoacetone oxidase family FAD-binding enzyme, partial [Clostridia bacterium]|nr:aminoacetone oxidase family FAD-binding enzyme [Clostridia bacterium]